MNGAQAPPFKRTRYDAMGGNSPQYPQSGYGGPPPPLPGGPPPALPPVGGSVRGGRGGGYVGPPSTRGGYQGERGGYGGASPVQSHASYGGGRGGYGPESYRGERDRGDYRDYPREREFDYPPPRDYRDRERDYPRDGPYRDDRPPYARERDGPPGPGPGPGRGGFGPGGRGGSIRGGRGGGHVGGPGRDTRPLPKSAPAPVDAPKGPRNARPLGAPTGPGGMSATNAAGAKKGERKWGNDNDRKKDQNGVENKKTLTDFRIEALEISELEWCWTGEVKRKREEKADGPVVKEEEEPATNDEAPGAEEDHLGDMSVEASAVKEEADEDEHDLGDMSIDAEGLSHLDDAFGSDPAQPTAALVDDKEHPTTNTTAVVEATEVDSAPAADTTATATAAEPTPDYSAEPTPDSSAEPTPAAGEAEADAPKKPLSKKQKRKEAAARRASLAAEAAAEACPATPTTKHGRDDSPPNAPGSAEAGDGGHGAKKPKVLKEKKLDLALPAKPQVLQIPTGPKNPGKAQVKKEDDKEAKENSRLRIYFSSPIDPPAVDKVAKLIKKEADKPVPAEGGVAEPPKEVDAAGEAAEAVLSAAVEAETAAAAEEDVDGEDIDGEEVDVDGEPVDGEAVPDEGAAEAEAMLVPARTLPVEPAKKETETAEAVAKAPSGQDCGVMQEQTGVVETAVQGETTASQPPTVDASVIAAVQSETQAEPEVKDEVELSPSLPSADRISISYARNTRRIVVDAAVVSVVRIHRAEGKIEVVVHLESALLVDGATADPFRACKGVLVERLSNEGGDEWVPVGRDELKVEPQGDDDAASPPDKESQAEELLPPLYSLLANQVGCEGESDGGLKLDSFTTGQITITALLAKANPLTEARWVKTGEVDAWIVSLGISSGVSVKDVKKPEGKLSEWKGKISVVDPDAVSRQSLSQQL